MATTGDWYRRPLPEKPEWHLNYKNQTAASGTTYGLAAGDVTQAGLDSDLVALIADYDEQLRAYDQAWTAWRDEVLSGDPLAAFTLPPVPPTLTINPLIPYKPGIEGRTRESAGIVRSDKDYGTAVGELYGIVAPAGTGPVTPSLRLRAIPGTGHVEASIAKGGYQIIAIDRRRAGGAWMQVGISQTATFVDTTATLVPGQPEQLDYRCQGMLNNARHGDLSDVVSVVTVP